MHRRPQTPFWRRCEEACETALRKSGYDFSFHYGGTSSKFDIPHLDHSFAAVSYETPAKHMQAIRPHIFAVKCVGDFDLSIQPYAIWRKDAKNEHVLSLVEKWGEAAEKRRRK